MHVVRQLPVSLWEIHQDLSSLRRVVDILLDDCKSSYALDVVGAHPLHSNVVRTPRC